MHKGDEIYISFPTLNITLNCLEFAFRPKFTSKRLTFNPEFTSRTSTSTEHNFTLLCAQNESLFDYVLNDLTTLHELLHDADMTLSLELKKF